MSINYRSVLKTSTCIIFEIFSIGLFYSIGNYFEFFLSWQMLLEISRIELIIYLMIKQNLLNLPAKVEFMKMIALQEKPQCVS